MSESENPYASPSAPQFSPDQNSPQSLLTRAGQGERFANFIIDYIAQFAISFGLGIVVVLIGGEKGAESLEETPGFFIGIPIFLAYYFVLEATTSRTLGKLLTGTKVVNEAGGTPTLGQVAGRTLCRLIPFEAFTFFGTPPRGLHDSMSSTMVIKTR